MEPIQRIKDQADKQAQFRLDESRHNQSLIALEDLKTSNIQAMRSLVQFLDGKVTRTEVVNQLKSISTPDVFQVVSAVEKLAEKIPPQLDLSSLETGLQALEAQLKLIPKENVELPEQKEDVRVTNLDEIDFTTLEKAIKGIKITTPAPTVNVSPTDVTVDVDLKPIQKGLTDLLKTVNGLKFPEPKETDLSKVEKKLDKSNELLKVISEKRMGGGGGGGNGTPYTDSTGKPVNIVIYTKKFATISASTSGDNLILAAVTGKKLKVQSVVLVASGTVSVKWRSNTTDISGAMPLVANSGFVLPSGSSNYFETAVGEALNINLSGAVAVNGHVSYTEE